MRGTMGHFLYSRDTRRDRSGTIWTLPDWHDVDAWRARLREAVDIPARRAVIADWAIATGGHVEHDQLVLPPDLPPRLATAEMTAMASYVGIRREAEL